MKTRLLGLLLNCLLLLPSFLMALDGNAIIRNANDYLSLEWECNDWNARTSNVDTGNWRNNDLRYPFFPQGAAIGEDENENIITHPTGQHTGMPYAWGLRETVGMFSGSDGRSGKLIGENNGRRMLAGNHDNTYQKPQLPSPPVS